jgi:nucleoside-diphosphate-sugar epimerase
MALKPESTMMRDPVLVTGASGYLASHVINALLAHGYNVRGTVRSEAASKRVKSLHSDYADRVSTILVPDMSTPTAFNEAVKGASGVIHTASPFVFAVENNERDLIQPAIFGTLNVLEAVAKHNASIRRVVVTSSFASIVDLEQGLRPGYRYTEEDWNPSTYESAKTEVNGSIAYCASKALAERSAWDWMAQHKPNFSLTTMCPPWIFGPSLEKTSSLSRLSQSMEMIHHLIDGSLTEVPSVDFAAFADVRDVAEAHVLSFESTEAANQRFLVAGGHFDYQIACDIIRANFPDLRGKTPEGVPGNQEQTYSVDGSKAKKILQLQYRSLQTTLTDSIKYLLKAEKVGDN